MEIIQGTHKASKFAPEEEDFISIMPDNLITNILDRVPLQDAGRTGVLSKAWRFKWTMLSHLVFDENFFWYLRHKSGNYNHVKIISRVLLQLRGGVTKCVLSLDDDKLDVEDEDIIQWILFLSRKGIKDLVITPLFLRPIKLPTHLFSCLELKRLKLYNCCINPLSNFHGFPNLLSLELFVTFGEKTQLGQIITRCPLLEILKLNSVCPQGTVKLFEIAKLENLKILSLSLCDLDTKEITSSSKIFEFVCSLSKLQELELNFRFWRLAEGGANKRFSTVFPGLKSLTLSKICLDDGIQLSYAFELIRSSPNLQTLEITVCNLHVGPPSHVDCTTTAQLQLRSVMFKYWNGSENEICLLKYVLSCSPFLKKIVIRPDLLSQITLDEKLKFASKLLKVHRASPVVDIDLS